MVAGPILCSALSAINPGPISSIAAAEAGSFTFHFCGTHVQGNARRQECFRLEKRSDPDPRLLNRIIQFGDWRRDRDTSVKKNGQRGSQHVWVWVCRSKWMISDSLLTGPEPTRRLDLARAAHGAHTYRLLIFPATRNAPPHRSIKYTLCLVNIAEHEGRLFKQRFRYFNQFFFCLPR